MDKASTHSIYNIAATHRVPKITMTNMYDTCLLA